MPKICILDYGLGNIKSLFNALNRIGLEVDYYSNNENKNYDLIFIPRIGSYNNKRNSLKTRLSRFS